MKKLFLIPCFLMFLVISACSVGYTDQVTITFGWQQDLPSPNDMKEWRLYKSATAGGPYGATPIAVFPWVSIQTEYTGQATVSYPSGQKTKYYFVMTATDTSGNESGYSNEVSLELDFQKPAAPKNLRIQ